MTRRVPLLILLLLTGASALMPAQAPVPPVVYRLSFPEPEHRWMQVEVTFTDVPAGPLQLRMSRSSPGRYALHEFAKNVFDVRITDAAGAPLPVTRPEPASVGRHRPQRARARRPTASSATASTAPTSAIDSTHAHINMPAALMWARGLRAAPRDRPLRAAGRARRGGSATQLLPGPDPFTFTAPNLQYLMDSPTEFSAFALRTFTRRRTSRATRCSASPSITRAPTRSSTRFAGDVETIVREARHVFGEYPAFEGNTYTFIADYLPWASGDGMEHRNSTILTQHARRSATNRLGLLDTVSHEFFHAWNVERIRPRSLEPFNFEDANMSGELWLAEGFTSYYGPLVLQRAGLIDAGRLRQRDAAARSTP